MKAEAFGSMCWSSQSRGVLLPGKKMLTLMENISCRSAVCGGFACERTETSTAKRVCLFVLLWMVSKSLHLDLRRMRRNSCRHTEGDSEAYYRKWWEIFCRIDQEVHSFNCRSSRR
ncbi:uncharacterized protein LOC104432407 isoform X2 [Eucalyptus grandis]|uniref:uncharacterized protein LOC104432407 isoform X2 n=1 Tax=Eucalyptus grandis TaxID=71139 RepID=UPI00192E940B|nr:uncharacterized protein LOC104432407 isoform X2 [Eucalyptus grandis]